LSELSEPFFTVPEEAMKTPFKLPSLASYPGGKASDGTFQRLINEIPPHENYIEPFLGGGSIMRHKRPAPSINLGLELDKQLFDLWQREKPAWVKVEQRNGLDYLQRMANVAKEDATVFDTTFIFIDPPYLNETLSNGLAPYKHRFTYDNHITLLNTCNQLRERTDAMLMVCALPNLLYESMLKGWRTLQYQNKTRNGMQTEQVWMNYDKPERLHDARYVGSNYRERERIKRAGQSMVKRLERLPSVERQAILETLRTVYP
jgi:site-specific DNA-adenine methylase